MYSGFHLSVVLRKAGGLFSESTTSFWSTEKKMKVSSAPSNMLSCFFFPPLHTLLSAAGTGQGKWLPKFAA